MALGKTEVIKKTYLSITNGKVAQDRGNGTKDFFSYVEGLIQGISQKEKNFNGEMVSRWYLDLKDGEDIYSVCFPYGSGVFKSVVLALASDEALSTSSFVRIEPYEKNGYTKAVVYSDGVRLDWVVKELPPIKEVEVGQRKVKDDSERMRYICELCSLINKRLETNK